MNLYLVSLLAIFGRGSEKPVLSALTKISAMIAVSLIAGYTLGNSIPALPPMGGSVWLHFLLTIAFGVQLTVLIVLISAASVINRRSQLSLFLAVLPISSGKRGRLLFMPSLVLIMCTLGLIIPGLTQLVPAKEQVFPLLVAIIVGALAAVGLAYPRRRNFIYYLAACVILLVEYRLLRSAIQSGWNMQHIVALSVLILSAAATKNTCKNIALTSNGLAKVKRVRMTGLPTWAWMAKKIGRNNNVRLSFFVAFSLACGLAALQHKIPLIDETYIGLFGQMLAGAYASDLRATARRYNPAEIAALKGSSFFTINAIIAGILTSALAMSPLIVSSILGSTDTLLLVVRLIAGASIGLTIGFWLVPSSHDISAQLSATLACLGVTLLADRLEISTSHPVYFYLFLTTATLFLTFIIEYKRNTYIWRPKWRKKNPNNKK